MSAEGSRTRRLVRRVTARMTAAHWSAVAIVSSFVLGIAVLALAYAFGGGVLRVHGQGSVEALLAGIAHGPWAAAGVMLVFSALALAGMPQFILIAATVVVFGPLLGAVYSWLATMGSAAFGFALGRLFAKRMIERFGGKRLNDAGDLVARHGILSSALIRNVPSAPFIVINVAAGATRMSTAKFLIGTALGILPKIAFIALAGTGLFNALESRKPEDYFLVIAVIAAWVAFGFWLKRAVQRRKSRESAPPPPGKHPST